MKNLLYLLFIVLVSFSCEQKPSEIDKKLQQEQIKCYQKSVILMNVRMQRFYETIHSRGYKQDEKMLFDDVFELQNLFLKINENSENKDSLKKLISLYEKQTQKNISFLESWKFKIERKKEIDYEQLLADPSFKEIQLFKNNFHSNHSDFLNLCFGYCGAMSLKFSSIETNLDAKKYNHGDTIHGHIFLNNYHYPMLPKINIDGNLVESYKYSQIIDSTQKQVLNIDVSYFKTIQKDTSLKMQIGYEM